MERGFVLSVVLILAAAMFAGNLGFDDSITGMQGTNTDAQPQDESCEEKCEREQEERDGKCMDDFLDAKDVIENEFKGCKNAAINVYVYCISEGIPVSKCISIREKILAKCGKDAWMNIAEAETKRNSCYDDSNQKYLACMQECNTE